jgi:predicted O-linked N-acetylglucosamine transferase (SPINDLY family)
MIKVKCTDAALEDVWGLYRRGDLRGALARCNQLLLKEPGNPELRMAQGVIRLEMDDPVSACEAFKRVLQRVPDHAEARFYTGLCYAQQGQHQAALDAFVRVTAQRGDWPEAHFYLGVTMARLGRMKDALEPLQRSIALNPDLSEAHHNLGGVLAELGRYADAVAVFERALKLEPAFAEAWNGLGAALFRLKQYDAAEKCYRRAIALNPSLVQAYTGLGEVLKKNARFHEARVVLEQAAINCPGDAIAQIELSGVLYLCGDEGAARAAGERALELAPKEARIWSPHLFNLHYDSKITAQELASLHRTYGERTGRLSSRKCPVHRNSPDPDRRLRVGLVSADFKRHSVGHFLIDLLPHLAGGELDLFAYANMVGEDEMTMEMKPHFVAWRNCALLDDATLADVVCADEIDILVDLSGHTAGQRLGLFACKPAPIQLTWLGYPDTTGLDCMDYILGDAFMLPKQEEGLFSELPWRMPETPLCFAPPKLAIEVQELPALSNGYVTFGCLNKRDKISAATISVWCALLNKLPDSRLLLQNRAYDDPVIRSDLLRQFQAGGVEGGRIVMIGGLNWQEHLECFNQIDIALDPFPYNGTTTSVEGLWMGIPFVALRGDRMVAHMGESILNSVGLADWVAFEIEDYVTRAAQLTADTERLADIRRHLRQRLLASCLCNAQVQADNLRGALRAMWQLWCDQRS